MIGTGNITITQDVIYPISKGYCDWRDDEDLEGEGVIGIRIFSQNGGLIWFTRSAYPHKEKYSNYYVLLSYLKEIVSWYPGNIKRKLECSSHLGKHPNLFERFPDIKEEDEIEFSLFNSILWVQDMLNALNNTLETALHIQQLPCAIYTELKEKAETKLSIINETSEYLLGHLNEIIELRSKMEELFKKIPKDFLDE